jgi:hypothetical protein
MIAGERLKEIVQRNMTSKKPGFKEEETIKFPFIVVEYSGNKKSNVKDLFNI